MEAFRGAIRKGQWKLIKVATLPGKTELFDVDQDPSETTNVAGQHPEVVKDLESRLLAYARQQKMSMWLKSQVDFLGFQGATVLDPEYNVDGGLPTEKLACPRDDLDQSTTGRHIGRGLLPSDAARPRGQGKARGSLVEPVPEVVARRGPERQVPLAQFPQNPARDHNVR